MLQSSLGSTLTLKLGLVLSFRCLHRLGPSLDFKLPPELISFAPSLGQARAH
ncbi:hypothetical protein PV326_012186, partial [Microctonus aethiopoides]